tara:strand:+ start:1145 stop:1636 length:492 start_codon:yes stop_codon:yes gene_type:complete
MDNKKLEEYILLILKDEKIDVKNKNFISEISSRINFEVNKYSHKNRKHKDNISINRIGYLIYKVVSNYKLLENKIEEKNINIDDIFNKNPIKLNRKPWAESLLKVQNEQNYLAKKNVSPNSNIRCYKCNEKTVFIHEEITRGMDEAPIVNHKCLSCGANWKIR